eukprot:g50930.t1
MHHFPRTGATLKQKSILYSYRDKVYVRAKEWSFQTVRALEQHQESTGHTKQRSEYKEKKKNGHNKQTSKRVNTAAFGHDKQKSEYKKKAPAYVWPLDPAKVPEKLYCDCKNPDTSDSKRYKVKADAVHKYVHICRYFGYFECPKCGHEWKSVWTWFALTSEDYVQCAGSWGVTVHDHELSIFAFAFAATLLAVEGHCLSSPLPSKI